jgi:hypothetical protein
MANQWFKFYGGEYLSDPKIERLSPLERSCWITILCMASMGNSGVIEFLTVESLLNRSGIQFDPYHPEEWEKALSVLVKFKNLKMIDTNEEGRITVKNWEKRQEHNLTVAERVAKHRENKKGNKNVTTNVTNVTTEENRIEENRITLSAEAPESESELTRERTDSEGSPLPQRDPKKPRADKEVLGLFALFAPINPAWELWHRNTTQREAAKLLLKKYGLEKTKKLLIASQKVKNEQFAPQVHSPNELLNKLANLKDHEERGN